MRISFLAKDRASTLLSSKIIGQSDTPFFILLSVHFPHSYVVFASNSMTKPSLDSSLIPNVYEPLNPSNAVLDSSAPISSLLILFAKKQLLNPHLIFVSHSMIT